MTRENEADDSESTSPGANPGPRLLATGISRHDVRTRPQLVDTPLGKLALVRDGDSIVAVDAWCPHLDGPLWEGGTAGGEIACPWHGWRYSLATGRCTWAPQGDAEEAAETEIRVLATETDERGKVFVVIADEGEEPSAEGHRAP